MFKDVRAVIFDFDGVIVDSEKLKFKHLKALLEKEGLVKEELRLSDDDFDLMVGMKTGAFLKKKFKKGLTNKKIHLISERRRKEQLMDLKYYAKPIPGVKLFIARLLNKKLVLCLATGSSREIVTKLLKMMALDHAFKLIIAGEDFKRSKPDPEVYNLAVSKLGIPKESILVIEDSLAGVEAAKKANLKTIAITSSHSKEALSKADFVSNSFKEIWSLIK